MKKEKIILSFIAVVIGLLVTGAAFYFYQATKVIPQNKKQIVEVVTPTPLEESSIFLSLDSPKDEEVFDKKTITVSGKTKEDAIIIISSDSDDQVVTPAKNGSFSATQSIDNGANKIVITAISPNGEEETITRTVTFSTESF